MPVDELSRSAVTAGTTLHVTNGDAAADVLRGTRLAGSILTWRDVLHEGPVPRVSAKELRWVRARFFSAHGWGRAEKIVAEFALRDATLVAALAAERELVLWFEHDLFDQLQLAQILAAVAESGHDPRNATLVCVGEVEGHP